MYHQAIEKTFLDPEVFTPIPRTPQYITSTLIWLTTSIKNMVDPTRGPSGKVANFHPATF